jgi:hypothetical protein
MVAGGEAQDPLVEEKDPIAFPGFILGSFL